MGVSPVLGSDRMALRSASGGCSYRIVPRATPAGAQLMMSLGYGGSEFSEMPDRLATPGAGEEQETHAALGIAAFQDVIVLGRRLFRPAA